VRRKINGANRFYAQLVCQGVPFHKAKHLLGEGTVGLDLGPSSIAVVGQGKALLAQFCAELEPHQVEIRRLQRQLDRQRRANNPDNFNADGTIKQGKKTWHQSRRQQQTAQKLAEVQRQQAAYRRSLHGQLVNRVLAMGNDIRLEKVSYRAFQKQFGGSVGFRGPGTFVTLLKQKAASAAARVTEFSTYHTRLSQTCHQCGTVEKKALSQRWHRCECGVEAQRDLYSAFLAQHVEDNRLNADRAKLAWSGQDTVLRAALSDAQAQLANGRALPASFGLSRKQSQSPGKAGRQAAKTFGVAGQASSAEREAAHRPEPPGFSRGE
jgi:transposase